MILSGQTIRRLCSTWPPMIQPFEERTEVEVDGKKFTYGLGPAGLDVRVEFDAIGAVGSLNILRDGFALASTIERFEMPNDVVGMVCDKSSWARCGLTVFNTIIEPGWRGFLTLELKNLGNGMITLRRGMPIAQIIFMKTDEVVSAPYGSNTRHGLSDRYPGQGRSSDKYQDQGRGPRGAR